MKKACFFYCLILLSAYPFKKAAGQCTIPVTHTSGTQQVNCTQVTATGVSSNSSTCGCGPYTILGSSYVFTFSPPVSGVRLNLAAINNDFNGSEEVAFHVNGSFYPISGPLLPIPGCGQPPVVSPGGTLQACTDCISSCKDLVILQNISSLEVEDIILNDEPAGVVFSLFICCGNCTTDAGVIPSGTLFACIGTNASFPPATQTILDSDDLLQYIIFTNISNPYGSIIATSNTPSFSYDPATMQPGLTYHIAAIAGNNLNGNVDLTDPCLDMSNVRYLTWRQQPAVVFSVANPNMCVGACTTVTANFTGGIPFTLTYTTPGSGPVTQTFSSFSGTFQVCTPNAGSVVIQATKVTDAWCTCE